MRLSLKLPHAKALASLAESSSPFERVRGASALIREANDLERAVLTLLQREVRVLRANGTTWGEIAERAGLGQAELTRLFNREIETPEPDAAAPAPDPAR